MTKASLFYKRSYTNGYEQKVNYYLDRLDQEIQNEDVDQIKFCKKKLEIGRAHVRTPVTA